MMHSPTIQKITIIIGQELIETGAKLGGSDSDPTIDGQLYNHSTERLVQLLGPVNDGTVFAFVNGKRYKMTHLRSDGRFTLQADF
jgi:hypothetical protein